MEKYLKTKSKIPQLTYSDFGFRPDASMTADDKKARLHSKTMAPYTLQGQQHNYLFAYSSTQQDLKMVAVSSYDEDLFNLIEKWRDEFGIGMRDSLLCNVYYQGSCIAHSSLNGRLWGGGQQRPNLSSLEQARVLIFGPSISKKEVGDFRTEFFNALSSEPDWLERSDRLFEKISSEHHWEREEISELLHDALSDKLYATDWKNPLIGQTMTQFFSELVIEFPVLKSLIEPLDQQLRFLDLALWENKPSLDVDIPKAASVDQAKSIQYKRS